MSEDSMSDEKTGLVPKLRFPEFREAGEWKQKQLEPYLVGYSERILATDNNFPIYSSTREGLKLQKEYYDGREIANEGEYGIVPVDHFVYRHMSDDTIFKFNINDTGRSIAVSKEYPVFKTLDLNSRFLFYSLNEGDEFKKFAETQRKGGTRTRLYFKVLCKCQILLPSLIEQQKIAACLSFLDALIAAQANKLDALKTHKAGLMQQLFPREGETVPRLRFAEFREAGEWKIAKAKNLFSNRVENGEDGIPIYSVTMNDGLARRDSLDRKIDDISVSSGNKKACKHDIVYNMMRMWQGASGVAVEDCMVSPAYVVLAASDDVCAEFYGYLFKLPQFLQVLTAHSQGLNKDRLRLYYKDFAQIPIPKPPLCEQQKIAACLSSLDAIITSKTEKLEALKTHKKGLMQQLFPSPQS